MFDLIAMFGHFCTSTFSSLHFLMNINTKQTVQTSTIGLIKRPEAISRLTCSFNACQLIYSSESLRTTGHTNKQKKIPEEYANHIRMICAVEFKFRTKKQPNQSVYVLRDYLRSNNSWKGLFSLK